MKRISQFTPALRGLAIVALCLAGPALAFDPQPDPPSLWWDALLHIWRWFGR